ncbi:MAG: (d)CMP kinase [Bacteroidales bacterium]|nr:(d)CMP kinase [Bacteroidales bacterium]MBR3946447.1 (d)CMP kinase [Bacteroidales bacterium]
MIIAIDGFACTGKSTVADALAKKIGFKHINSGMFFRQITLLLYKKSITPKNLESNYDTVEKLVSEIKFDNLFSQKELKQQEIGELGSLVAKIPIVRNRVNEELHNIARNENVIIDGRDIGTNVFPNAEFKFFFVVNTDERAKRLIKERNIENTVENFEKSKKEIETRDHNDLNRDISPLKKANDAIEINRDNLSVEETVALLYKKCNSNL